MPMEKKFITLNGVLQRNPAWVDPNAAQSASPVSTVANPARALTIVTSPDDAIEVSETLMQPVPLSTAATIEMIQDDDITTKLNVKDGSLLLDGISKIFAQYEIPVGLLNKLLMLNEYALNFKIDDSGSMQSPTDSTVKDVSSEYMREKFITAKRRSDSSMTRWEEAEDRLHIFIAMLAYIPTGPITLTFLNRRDALVLDRTGKTPEQFPKDAHEKITSLFVTPPAGRTPMLSNLTAMFAQSTQKTMHYVLTDGVPSDATPEQVAKLVITRQHPQDNPLTFLSCTNEDAEAQWMKDIEEIAPFTAELDDFGDEKAEVLNDQGPAFPYSKGFWLLANLVAAINPDDLDALDESAPFTKGTMENLMGRALSQQEYNTYFSQHPAIDARVHATPNSLLAKYRTHFAQNYQQFCRMDIVSGQIPCVQAYREEMRRQTMKESPFGNMLQGIPLGYGASPQAMFGGGYTSAQTQPAPLGAAPILGTVMQQQATSPQTAKPF